jgi:hypothetical protein
MLHLTFAVAELATSWPVGISGMKLIGCVFVLHKTTAAIDFRDSEKFPKFFELEPIVCRPRIS